MDSTTEIFVGKKRFRSFISNAHILSRIAEVASEINARLQFEEIDILVVLDGAETFAKAIQPLFLFKNQMHFIRLKTYEGMRSGAVFNTDDLWFEKLNGKNVLILEDIIDSGFTAHKLIEKLTKRDVRGVHLATLLIKPGQLKYPLMPDFMGFEIGPEFVIGFGMDYNEDGRNLEDIYQCMDP